MNPVGIVTLKHGREKPLLQKHPWVFSGAVAQADGSAGGLVDVRDQTGRFLARGYYNPRSQIVVRALCWDESEIIDSNWWYNRLAEAVRARGALLAGAHVTSCRLVHAESDGLPGLIVDRYVDSQDGSVYLVLQALTLGIEVVKQQIVDLLIDLLRPRGIVERSDVDVRQKEGLPDSVGMLWGDPPPMPLVISEYERFYPVDVFTGHKTGFYLDQRDSRSWLQNLHLRDGEVLNAFSYTGAFGACLPHVCRIVHIDSSQPALELARQTMSLNSLQTVEAEYVCADVFQQLRAYREAGRTFDLIILDPPKFASHAAQIERAARGYKDINLLAFQLLRPGGLLVTFSCSGRIDPDLFQKIVFGASVDAGRQAQIVAWLGQPADHPVLLSFPEGRYLKGLVCRVCDF